MAATEPQQQQKSKIVCRAISGKERESIPDFIVSDYYSEVGDHQKGVKHQAAYHKHAVGHYLGSASWDKNGNLTSYHALKGYEAAIGAYLLSPKDFQSEMIGRIQQNGGDQQLDLIEGILIPKEALRSHRIAFTVDIQYEPNLAQDDQETSPQIHFYLSADNARGVNIFTGLDADKSTTLANKTLEFDFIRSSMTYDCMLNIDVYAQHRNERRVWCTNQAGYANCPLLTLITTGKVCLDLNVVNSSWKDANKGSITLIMTECSHLKARTSQETLALGDPTDRVRQDIDQKELVVKDYIEKNRELYQSMPATISSTRNITVFVDQCRKGYAPGSMFDVFRPPKAHDEYFLNCLNLGAQRMFRSSEPVDLELMFLTDKIAMTVRTTVVMWMLCVYVTNCAYIMDEVDHNKRKSGSSWSKENLEYIESFGDAEPGDTGDCEDFSRVIIKHVSALKYHRQRHEDSVGASIIDKVVEILDRFVFCAGLCGVTSASIDFSKSEGENGRDVKLQGHEAAFAIPKHIWFTAISRCDPSHPIMKFRDLALEDRTDVIYPLEGTGVLNPLPKEKTRAEQQYQASLQLDDLRVEYTYHPSSTRNFYKVFRTFMTEEFFMQGCPYSEFALYMEVRNPRGGTQKRCGAWFHHLLKIEDRPDIGLRPCPTLTPQVIDSYAYVTKDDYPVHKFCQMVTSPVSAEFVGQLNLDPTPSALSDSDWLSMNYYISLDEMTQSIASNLLALKKNTNSRIRCHLELVRQNPNGHVVGSYVVTIFRSINA